MNGPASRGAVTAGKTSGPSGAGEAGEAGDAATLTIRRPGPADAAGIGDVWLASWRATFDFEPAYPDETCRRWLATEVVPLNETWVAVDGDSDGAIVALMALSDEMIEQLYVAPAWIGRGLGRRLVEFAMDRRPAGLDLFCFVVNAGARGFYERMGFRAVAVGDGSRNAERQPEIRFAWRPFS